MRTIAVLGGGIGGLAASYYLCKIPSVAKVIVLESTSRFGGWLWSTRRSDGAVFEHGPRGIRPTGPVGRNTLNMVEDLGLEKEILSVRRDHVASQNRYLYVNKKLHRMPSGISGVVHTVTPFSRPLLLDIAKEVLVKKGQKDDESIHSFISRRLGKELADIAVDSFCRGIFAGDCRKLSMRSCFPAVYNVEQRRRSLILGTLLDSVFKPAGSQPVVPAGSLAQRAIEESWTQWSLKRGVESLPESIAEYLERSGRVQLHRDAPVKQITPSASGWKIDLEDGVISADHIISALPANALSSALPQSCQPLAQQLQEICYVTVAVVNLEYDGSVLPAVGFGHLLPSWEDQGVLGVVYDSVAFPQHNSTSGQTTRLTVMMGGAWFQETYGDPERVTEEFLLPIATQAVRSQLGITAAPRWSRVMLHRDCIPQYYEGHHQRLESIQGFIKKNNLSLSLIGSSYEGVSVNDVIFSGRRAVEELFPGET